MKKEIIRNFSMVIVFLLFFMTIPFTQNILSAGNFHSVYGGVYIDDVLVHSEVEVILSFENGNESYITSSGYYIINFRGHDWTTGKFYVHHNGTEYVPEDGHGTQVEVEIWEDIMGYWINLSIYTTSSNHPPNKPTNPVPGNNSDGISLIPTLSVDVSDPNVDTMNVSFYNASGDILIGTDTGVASGRTASVAWSGLFYNTTYQWYAVANDSEFENRSDTWNFTTKEPGGNHPPNKPTNPVPGNNSDGISLIPTLSVDVSDPNVDTMNVSFYNASDDILIGTDTGVASGRTASVAWSGLFYNTTYQWYAVANDSEFENRSDTWNFTTEESVNDSPVFSGEIPSSGSNDIPVTMSSLSVTIEDIEGDSFDWNIETSPDIGNSSGSSENNGTNTCSISSLSYSTTYTWYVNATDPSGSGTYTREIYVFTTESAGGDGDGDGDVSYGSGNVPPTADASASEKVGYIGESLNFDGSLSTDSDGTIELYEWDWDNDGTYDYNSTSSTATHTFDAKGTYSVTLRVTDNVGAADTDTIDVIISKANVPPTEPIIDGPSTGRKNTDYEYIAISTDADNDMIQYIFDWGDGETNTTDFLPNGTATMQTHSWATAEKYTISVKAYDNETKSGTTKLIVFIDVHYVKDIGHLIDDDSDTTYDIFYSNSTGNQTDVQKQDDSTYLIDSDGDGSWDYAYDIETDTLSEYSEPTPELVNTSLYILAIIVILFLIILGYLVKRSNDKKKAQKKAAEKKSQSKKKDTTKKSQSKKKDTTKKSQSKKKDTTKKSQTKKKTTGKKSKK